jgi:hypothetical protein
MPPALRSATEVGPGDRIKVGNQWKTIKTNTAFGETRTPRNWSIVTTDGAIYSMWDVKQYAKADDPR